MPLPPLDLSLALGIGPSSTSNTLKSGAATGPINFNSPTSTASPWSAYVPLITVAGVGALAAFIIYKMRRP